jgi:hypothetical protein
MHAGKVGKDFTTEEAAKLAQLVAVNIIATIKGVWPCRCAVAAGGSSTL